MTGSEDMVNEETTARVDQSMSRIVNILVSSINALAQAGEVETACRLAGQACVALRQADLKAARQFDVMLHRMTPMLRW